VVELYEVWLREQIRERNPAVCAMLNRIYLAAKEGDVMLACWCAPLTCHGHIIRKVVEEKLAPVA
jgi:hypothetical protein